MFTFPNYHKTPEQMLLESARVQREAPSSVWVWKNSDYMDNNYWIPITTTIAYILFLQLGTAYMKNRKEFDLRGPLIIWNFSLALFSIIGAASALPSYLRAWFGEEGLIHELCHIDLDLANPWVFYFVLSKIPELFDTVFIVLRKRPLRFLQYYHHIATMWFCWFACARKIESGGAFAVMNLTVHSVMYTYFGCAAAHIRWPGWARLSITVMQVTQMILGTCFVIIVFMSCLNDRFLMSYALIMYTSYFVLFGKLLYENCIGVDPEQGGNPKSKAD